jgi:hypothetical protein
MIAAQPHIRKNSSNIATAKMGKHPVVFSIRLFHISVACYSRQTQSDHTSRSYRLDTQVSYES